LNEIRPLLGHEVLRKAKPALFLSRDRKLFTLIMNAGSQSSCNQQEKPLKVYWSALAPAEPGRAPEAAIYSETICQKP
jgi:hypothetical protein